MIVNQFGTLPPYYYCMFVAYITSLRNVIVMPLVFVCLLFVIIVKLTYITVYACMSTTRALITHIGTLVISNTMRYHAQPKIISTDKFLVRCNNSVYVIISLLPITT